MKGFFETELGKVYIDPTMITRLSILPELALSDVFVLPNGPVSSEPLEIVNRKGADRYIHVEFNGDGMVMVELRLLVRYGPSIRSSAALFQDKITRRVEASTGLKVARVDVKIDGIYRPTPPVALPAPSGIDNRALPYEEAEESGS
jgi:uncharacterized alkaline shock family protein YloU